jgi:hypothetical protein
MCVIVIDGFLSGEVRVCGSERGGVRILKLRYTIRLILLTRQKMASDAVIVFLARVQLNNSL